MAGELFIFTFGSFSLRAKAVVLSHYGELKFKSITPTKFVPRRMRLVGLTKTCSFQILVAIHFQ